MVRGATTNFTTCHLSGAWHVRAIRTHATLVARGVQSVNKVLNESFQFSYGLMTTMVAEPYSV